MVVEHEYARRVAQHRGLEYVAYRGERLVYRADGYHVVAQGAATRINVHDAQIFPVQFAEEALHCPDCGLWGIHRDDGVEWFVFPQYEPYGQLL